MSGCSIFGVKSGDFGSYFYCFPIGYHGNGEHNVIILYATFIYANYICNMKKFEDPLQNEFGTLSQKTGLKNLKNLKKISKILKISRKS